MDDRLPAAEPLRTFCAELKALHQRAGHPTLKWLNRHMAGQPSEAALSQLLNGKLRKAPDWTRLAAFVAACREHAAENRLMLQPGDTEEGWRVRHTQLEADLDLLADRVPRPRRSRPALDARFRTSYVQALTSRYRVLDLAALTPEAQDEQLPTLLRSVFVPQWVRAEPPPVELPRDLWRRLVDTGDLDADELPEDMDREVLARARDAHAAQSPRPVLELLLDPSQRLITLLGDPGAGKSSLARYLALCLAGDDPTTEPPPELAGWRGWLPVLVELRTYASPHWRIGRWADGTLLDYLDHLHAQEGLGLPREVLDAHLRDDGRAVVMFDGLDELFDPLERDTVARRIAAFAAQYPRVRVLVTSRVIGYRRPVLDAAGFALHTLQDLDTTQVERFVRRWYELACRNDPGEAAGRTARLLTAIGNSVSVRDLAGNPMLLTILAVIGRRRELPRERHRVYQHAVEVLVQHWDLNRAVRDARVEMDHIDEEDKRELLRRVARRMQQGRGGIAGNHIHRDELLTEFRTYLQEQYRQPPDQAKIVAAAMLEQFRERNFILSRFGPGVYGFVHRAFLEYCCADEIVYRVKESQELSVNDLVTDVFGRHATDPTWQEVLLLIAGMIHERFLAQVIDHLLDLGGTPRARLDPDNPARHWLLALRCLAEARKIAGLQQQGLRITHGLIELFNTAHLQSRTLGVLPVLGVVDSALPVFQELGTQLPGRDPYLAWYTRQEGSRYAFSSTQRIAETSAAIAVTLFPNCEELRLLLQHRATTDPDGYVRGAAVAAVGRGWPDEQTRTWLTDRATTDPDGYVRGAAVEAVGRGWPDEQTRTWLTDRATTDPDG